VSEQQPSQITAVLLPDGLWHEIEPGTYSFSDPQQGHATGRFVFRVNGETYRGPHTSVLATREQ
jgi:hypothetical protein